MGPYGFRCATAGLSSSVGSPPHVALLDKPAVAPSLPRPPESIPRHYIRVWTAGKDSRRTDLSTGKVSTAILLAQEPLTAAPLAADQWERLITRLADRSGRRRDTLAGLPFSPDDVTAGSETELQAAVAVGGDVLLQIE